MQIEHLAIWTTDIEVLRGFYCAHFGCTAGPRYNNPAKGFSSYFLTFDQGARLEIMQKTGLQKTPASDRDGLAHFAVTVGSEVEVVEMTNRLRGAGVRVASEPRWTGDGYFESVIHDPDGNAVEITV